MIRGLTTLLVLLGSTFAAAEAERAFEEQIDRWYEAEADGLRNYDRGDYAKAYDTLAFTAVRGLKRSQYILGFMYLKGQHVDKSILTGMGWLGVASESGDSEWQDLYDSMYEMLAPEHRPTVDAKVQEFIAKYGSDTQGVSCTRSKAAGSRRLQTRCRKVEGIYNVFPIGDARKP
jgi:TPR repeat protein